MKLQRAFERRQRVEAGLDNNPHPQVLETFNNTLKDGQLLHATKGYRTIREKRMRAMIITAEMRKGMFPIPIVSADAMHMSRSFITKGMYK